MPVGRIAGLFGVRGELKCDPTNAGRSLFQSGERFSAALGDDEMRDVELRSVREHQGRLLVTLCGVETAESARPFAGATLYADRERIALKSNEYFDQDLVGCELFDKQGFIGKVERVDHYPGADMLVVNAKLVPLIDAFVKGVDTKAKRIDVELPPGLLD